MRRADRLFQIIQILRRHRDRPVTAAEMASELEVSPRTIYRDVADLQGQRVPIAGEAGVGYVLKPGYDLPALMFTEDEIEALVLGARIVQSWADPALGAAAGDVLAKIEAVVPEGLKARIRSLGLAAPPTDRMPAPTIDVPRLRLWVREQRKVRLLYEDAEARTSTRTVWPLALAFFPPVWLMVGWCEMRQDFRSFRLDRVVMAAFLEERFPQTPGRRLTDFVKRVKAERRRTPERPLEPVAS